MMNPGYTAEIKATLTKYAEFYTKKDASGIVSLYLPDGDIVAIAAGKDEKNAVPAGIFEKPMRKNFPVIKRSHLLTIRHFLLPPWDTLAGFRPIFSQTAYWPMGPIRSSQGGLRAVLRKTGGKWLFVQSHFSIPAEGPAIYRK